MFGCSAGLKSGSFEAIGMRSVIFAVLVSMAYAEEEKPASDTACAMAATLLGSISFQMSLFYLLNHSDPDMRKYSYEVVVSTISIFCAVLLFQSIQGVVEEVFLDGAGPLYATCVGMVHMLIWFALTQFSLAYISGALADFKIGKKPTDIRDMEANMKCWATLLAHMTGFAAINAFGTMQQLEIFSWNPLFCALAVPIAVAGIYGMQRVTDTAREYISTKFGDGEKDEFEHAWDEETEEAENDVMGLALSFLITQTIRYTISGVLPNEEGEEEGAAAFSHTTIQIVLLFATGLLAVGSMAYYIFKEPEEREDHHKTEAEEIQERFIETIIVTMSMVFAWCCFFTGRWYLGTFNVLADDPMLLALALALLISAISFVGIRILDICADAEWSGPKVDEAIFKVIGAIGILVGFSWEQAFDTAVGSLASRSSNPAIMKLGLALFCVVIIVPAWRWWLLPMVIEKGWLHGFVVEDEAHIEEIKKAHMEKEEEEKQLRAKKDEERKKKNSKNAEAYQKAPA
eukprot:gnl/MRDRNA2_/MRDRNA2_129691_c0_seq1.p1 gnl/MRDRNA2_/MRDRNA2_129691_c0~~gnl/MRDRNA2_/MRDRNA2_129691_c0_seq1.p1  ORF type:complete len:516 (+),score=119.85 gnl/MRDRNA2_/MRDRNA2_129691_c0_seq1:124-1671(+)